MRECTFESPSLCLFTRLQLRFIDATLYFLIDSSFAEIMSEVVIRKSLKHRCSFNMLIRRFLFQKTLQKDICKYK